MITFGTVIRHKEAEFVCLAATADIIYLAKILKRDDGNKIYNLYCVREKTGKTSDPKISNSALYCFVMLSTAEFKDRMAHLAKPPLDHDFESQFTFDVIRQLDNHDLKEIKDTIMTSGHVPMELKDLIKDVEI